MNSKSYVVLRAEDARNILSMLNESICRLESGTRRDNDIEVFGGRAISYERLVDLLGEPSPATEIAPDGDDGLVTNVFAIELPGGGLLCGSTF